MPSGFPSHLLFAHFDQSMQGALPEVQTSSPITSNSKESIKGVEEMEPTAGLEPATY